MLFIGRMSRKAQAKEEEEEEAVSIISVEAGGFECGK